MSDETKTFGESCIDLVTEIQTLIAAAKGLIIRAQAENPLNVPEGLTVDEQQLEITANVELALRHLEDASIRLATASIAFGTETDKTADSASSEKAA